MANKNVIKRGPYEGLTLINVDTLKQQKKEAKRALNFPLLYEGVLDTEKYLKQGKIVFS